MDTITHTLLGALVARATGPSKPSKRQLTGWERVMAGGLAAAFPDVDYLTFWINPLVFLSEWHRGPTHSLVLLPLWALALGFSFAIFSRRRQKWKDFVLVCALGLLSHIALDVITVYGTMIFAPLSSYRASLGMTFVIDPWVTALIFVSLAGSIVGHSRFLSQLGLICVIALVGIHWSFKQEALTLAKRYIESKGMVNSTAYAIPQPLSPLNWALIIRQGDIYHRSLVTLSSGLESLRLSWVQGVVGRLSKRYRASDDQAWEVVHAFGNSDTERPTSEQVWSHTEFEPFRNFAAMPVLYRIDTENPKTCVWFTDLRYVLPELIPPFRYGMCRSGPHGAWRLYRLRRFSENDRHFLGACRI